MEENDHRRLGQELDLFTFSDLVGAGLPLWTPKGTRIRALLDQFIWEMREAKGYERVTIPHITKKDLYEKSGHWQKFADELFKITSREGREYAMKPMNCPHHTQIYDRKPHSYRELPQRYAETTMVYRDEQSGELGGLTRVLSITQDDAHVFCRSSQVKEEFLKIWDIIDTFYKTFGFTLRVRLSFRDPAAPEKYLGTPEIWDRAESELRAIAKERGADTIEGPGEAALYGPKLDFIALSAAGREWQVATIQLDMNIPERFDLTCVNEKGEKERIVMIHAAIAGSLERVIAVLLEHYAGALPLWLAPVQVAVLPVGEGHKAYAEEVLGELKAHGIRGEIISDDSLGKRIREAKMKKIPCTFVVGDKEAAGKTVSIENNRDGKKMVEPLGNATQWLLERIKERANI